LASRLVLPPVVFLAVCCLQGRHKAGRMLVACAWQCSDSAAVAAAALQ
jgi:hypothetical protein